MKSIMESAFSAGYLILAAVLGIYILKRGKKAYRLFGIMTLILCGGDAFHLIPRIMSAFGDSPDALTGALGFGTLVTSVTMTVFYLLLYHFWRARYKVTGRSGLTAVIYGLAFIRIALCLFPQNRWFDADAPVSWGIYRNIPFLLLGIVIIVLYYRSARGNRDRGFRFLWLAVLLSFAFYIPVVLWADAIPLIGILMLPKTCAYVWIIWMGVREVRSPAPTSLVMSN